MSNSPIVAADTPKPAAAPDQAAPAAPQQNPDNKQAEAKPAQQK